MGTPFTVVIPYDTILLLVMGLFMFVGATRGAFREAITTVGLVVLLAILLRPELAQVIVGYLSRLLRLIIAFFRSGFSVNPETLLGTYGQVKVPFTGENPYPVLILALVVFVFLSYGSRGGKDVTAFSRIVGGLLGLFNGFLVVTLFKDYVVKYITQRNPAEVAALGAPPAEVSVALSRLPTAGLLANNSLYTGLALLGALTALLLIGSVGGVSLKKKKG
jgi:hypothetical protein